MQALPTVTHFFYIVVNHIVFECIDYVITRKVVPITRRASSCLLLLPSQSSYPA